MKDKLTFANLVDKIASETGATKKLVRDLLKEMVVLNKENLVKDGKNNFPDFGSLSVKWHKAKLVRNPSSGEINTVPAHAAINFKAQNSIGEHINRAYSHLHPELIKIEPMEGKENPPFIPVIEKETLKTIEEVPVKENKKDVFIPIQEVSKRNPPPPEKEEKSHTSRWWLFLFLLALFLVFIFWPTSNSKNEIQSPKKETQNNVPKKTNSSIENQAPAIQTQELIVQKDIARTPSQKISVEKGEYYYTIAKKYYHKEALWPLIYYANYVQAENPDFLQVGREIIIPALQGIPENLSVQDKKELAQAYVEIYLVYNPINHIKAMSYLWTANQLDTELLKVNRNRISEKDVQTMKSIKGKLKY